MKICTLIVLVCLSFSGGRAESPPEPAPLELQVGDSTEKVIRLLGEPKGKMESGDFSIYYYKLGSIHINAGKISSLDLISEEEWQRRRTVEETARAARKEKGEELLASIKADEQFAALPAGNRLAFWEQFRRDYPEVDVYVLYSQAKVEADKDAEKQQEANRLAELERRVLMAEAQARSASQAAQAAQTQQLFNQNRYYDRYPSVVVVPQPYIIRKKENGHHKPKPEHPIYPGTSISGVQVSPGFNVSVGGSFKNQTTTTTTNTSGFVNGRGVLQVQGK